MVPNKIFMKFMAETSLGTKSSNTQAYIHSIIHPFTNIHWLCYRLEINLAEINGKPKIGSKKIVFLLLLLLFADNKNQR